jgi:hypothetical protein
VAESEITVRREARSLAHRAVAYRVMIDGKEVGRLRSGQEITHPVEPGEHRVSVGGRPGFGRRFGFRFGSDEVQVVVPPAVMLTCRPVPPYEQGRVELEQLPRSGEELSAGL